LKGTFSRYDYQRSQNTGSPSHIPEFTEYLPAAAADVYYRDSIGNITTSHLRDNLDSIELILQPRFPLFGGWKTAYYMGYNLPLPGILFLDNSDSSHYVLNISFGINFPDAVIDHYTVRIILPEGAKNIEFTTPFAIDKHSFDTHYTYLDTSGRPVLVLEKSNVVIEHNENFLVAYHFSTISMLQEPFLLVGAFFCFFLFVMIYIRFDFSIGESRKSDPHKHQIEVHLYELKEEIEKREEVHERVSKSYQKFLKSRNTNEFDRDRASSTTDFSRIKLNISKIRAQIDLLNTSIAKRISEIESAEDKRVHKIAEIQKHVSVGKPNEKALKSLENEKEDLDLVYNNHVNDLLENL